MTATKLNLDEQQIEEVEQLCAEFDPQKVVPKWMKQRGHKGDWTAYLHAEQHELRGNLEVAVLIGRALKQLNPKSRLGILYDITQELATPADLSDYEAGNRLHKPLSRDESNCLSELFHGNCEAACRRALFIDTGPQAVAS